MIKSTQNKGFSLTFQNGLTISVQFGTSNYCERRDYTSPYKSEMLNDQDIIKSQNAEIAIWDKDNNWFDFGSDTVKGWCSANEIANWIEKVSNAINIASITNEELSQEDLKNECDLNALENQTYEG